MPPPLVTQDGLEAFEHAAFGVVGQSSATTIAEPELIQHAFYALNVSARFPFLSHCTAWSKEL